MVKRVSRVGLVISVVWSVIVFLWERVGDLQQAEEFFRERGAILEMVGRLALAPWFSPAIAVICLAIYLTAEQDARTFGSSASRENQDR